MRIAIKYIALTAMASFLNSLAVLADTTSDNEKVVEHLRNSFEETQQMPLDRKLYVENLLVTHNYDPGGHVDTTKFLMGVRKELRAAKEAGLNQKFYSSHSLRAGAATTAANRGVPPYLIQKLGRWHSECYRIYIKSPSQAIRRAQHSMLVK